MSWGVRIGWTFLQVHCFSPSWTWVSSSFSLILFIHRENMTVGMILRIHITNTFISVDCLRDKRTICLMLQLRPMEILLFLTVWNILQDRSYARPKSKSQWVQNHWNNVECLFWLQSKARVQEEKLGDCVKMWTEMTQHTPEQQGQKWINGEIAREITKCLGAHESWNMIFKT